MNQMPALTTSGNKSPGLGDRRLATLWIATAGAVVLHNIEEWLFDMTGWVAAHPGLPGRALHGDQVQFEVALVIVTATVLILAATAVAFRPRWSRAAPRSDSPVRVAGDPGHRRHRHRHREGVRQERAQLRA